MLGTFGGPLSGMLQLLVAVVRMTTVSTSVTVASLTFCTTGTVVVLVVDVPD